MATKNYPSPTTGSHTGLARSSEKKTNNLPSACPSYAMTPPRFKPTALYRYLVQLATHTRPHTATLAASICCCRNGWKPRVRRGSGETGGTGRRGERADAGHNSFGFCATSGSTCYRRRPSWILGTLDYSISRKYK